MKDCKTCWWRFFCWRPCCAEVNDNLDRIEDELNGLRKPKDE